MDYATPIVILVALAVLSIYLDFFRKSSATEHDLDDDF